MNKAIQCLALQLPEPVWNDVNARWQTLAKQATLRMPPCKYPSMHSHHPKIGSDGKTYYLCTHCGHTSDEEFQSRTGKQD